MSEVVKSSGAVEPFSEDKLVRSLQNARAEPQSIERVVRRVRRRASTRIKSAEVYRIAERGLKSDHTASAARYRLREAVADLGPTGYPFERFVAALLTAEGMPSKTSITLTGTSGVRHEIDVIANVNRKRYLCECKFRRDCRQKIDVKIAMYVSARARDLLGDLSSNADETFYVVTNAKFTTDAVQFAKSVGLELIGWTSPGDQSLNVRIQKCGLHPLTCLTTLKTTHKRKLLDRGLVLSRELLNKTNPLRRLSLSASERRATRAEIESLLAT